MLRSHLVSFWIHYGINNQSKIEGPQDAASDASLDNPRCSLGHPRTRGGRSINEYIYIYIYIYLFLSMHIFIFCFLLIGLTLYGCTVPRPAPVESRAVKPQEKPTDFYSNSDRRKEEKNGHYFVQEGDTLFGIALAFGQNWRDIASWNSLSDPDKISVGQKLRVKPLSENLAGAVSIPLETQNGSQVQEMASPKSASKDNELALNKAIPNITPDQVEGTEDIKSMSNLYLP